MSDPQRGAAPALDIKALLRVALDRGPRDDVQQRVMDRVAAATTAAEFARLIFVAPWRWIVDAREAEEVEHAE